MSDYNSTIWHSLGLQQCIPMSEQDTALVTTMFTVGGLISSIIVGLNLVNTNFGRKVLSFSNAFLFFCGSALMCLSNCMAQLNVGRLLTGMAAGLSLVVSPILVSELTPFNHRGLLGSILQFSVALGILTAQLVAVRWANDHEWRYIFLFAAVLGLVQGLALFTTVESPKWLVFNNGDVSEAALILLELRSDRSTVDPEIANWRRMSVSDERRPLLDQEERELSSPAESLNTAVSVFEFLTQKQYRKQVVAILVIMTAQQLCGMNAITFYGVSLLANIMPKGTNVLWITCSLTLSNVVTALAISPVVDRAGRKPLMLVSTLVMAVNAAFISMGLTQKIDWLTAGACFGFIVGFSVGLMQVPFLMVSELVGHDTVDLAQSFGVTLNWCSSIAIAYVFPMLERVLGGAVFYVFCGIGVFYFIAIVFTVPETMGRTDISQVWKT